MSVEIVSCCGMPVGEIVGGVVGFVVGQVNSSWIYGKTHYIWLRRKGLKTWNKKGLKGMESPRRSEMKRLVLNLYKESLGELKSVTLFKVVLCLNLFRKFRLISGKSQISNALKFKKLSVNWCLTQVTKVHIFICLAGQISRKRFKQ